MERVKNILQRLQEVYYGKHQKTAIDIDLMLDYTRVMYADLLEWRGTFKEEPPTREKAEPNTAIVNKEEDKHEEPAAAASTVNANSEQEKDGQEPEPAAEEAATTKTEKETDKPEPAAEETATTSSEQQTDEPEPEPSVEETTAPKKEPETDEPKPGPAVEEPAPVPEEPAPVTEPEEEDAAVSETQQPADKAYQPMQHDDPLPREPVTEDEGEPVVETEPEKEPINTLQQDASGISFEPPSPPEPKTEIKEELLIEEPAVQPVVAEKAAPPPADIPLPDMNTMQKQPVQAGNLFSSVKTPGDIRSAIGINDKYLFLNELFRNHKSNYEETLDQLNHFSTAQQAEDWIRTRVAPVNKWEQDDATVASFYSIIQRHFSER